MKNVTNNENIFDVIESNMFSILVSKDKRLNYNLLVKIKDYIDTSGENRVNKEEIIDFLDQYAQTYINLTFNDEEDKPILAQNLSDKIRIKLRQFIKYGWLSEDNDNDLIIIFL